MTWPNFLWTNSGNYPVGVSPWSGKTLAVAPGTIYFTPNTKLPAEVANYVIGQLNAQDNYLWNNSAILTTQTFTASTGPTGLLVPPGATVAIVTMCGGGGGGGCGLTGPHAVAQMAVGGGGGAGAPLVTQVIPVNTSPSNNALIITVGAGGAGGLRTDITGHGDGQQGGFSRVKVSGPGTVPVVSAPGGQGGYGALGASIATVSTDMYIPGGTGTGFTTGPRGVVLSNAFLFPSAMASGGTSQASVGQIGTASQVISADGIVGFTDLPGGADGGTPTEDSPGGYLDGAGGGGGGGGPFGSGATGGACGTFNVSSNGGPGGVGGSAADNTGGGGGGGGGGGAGETATHTGGGSGNGGAGGSGFVQVTFVSYGTNPVG